MKSLATLIRLRKHTLDEARRELTELQRAMDAIDQARAELEREFEAESAAAHADVEAAYGFGNYLATVREKHAALDRQADDLVQRIALAEAGVRDAFREVKQLEIADARRQERARLEAGRREQAALDEMALSAFRRQDAE